jgi:hypothetical protein
VAPGALRQILEQKPFRPVRVFTGDGSVFDIKSREFCFLSPKGRTLVVFGGEGQNDDNDEDFRLVDVFLITKLETEGRSAGFTFAPEQKGDQPA